MLWLALRWILARIPLLGLAEYNLSGHPAVVYSAALLVFGAQILSIGFVAELMLHERRNIAREYSIKEKTDDRNSLR